MGPTVRPARPHGVPTQPDGRDGSVLDRGAPLRRAAVAVRAAIRVTLRQRVHPHGPEVRALADRNALISIRSRQPPALWTRDRPPHAGQLPAAARTVLRTACEPGADVQLVIAAGALRATPRLLSALLPALWHGCAVRGRSVGRPIVVHGWHAGIDAEIGRLLGAKTILLLVDDTAARGTRTRISAYVVQPHATGPSADCRVRTDGDAELVALRLLAAISRQRATLPEWDDGSF